MSRPLFRSAVAAALILSLMMAFATFFARAGSGKDGSFKLVAAWGTTGEEPGRFREPMGLAFGPDGNLYVADTRNARVQKLTPDGRFLLAWGRPGEGPGEFSKPVDVAVDGEGRVYVSDYDLDRYVADAYNNRIQKFTPEGEYLDKWGGILGWGIPASWEGWFRVPSGIAVDAQGRIFVADSANHRMVALSSRGRVLAQWNLELPTELFSPNRVAVGHDGRIFAADTAHDRILVFEFISR